MEKVVEFPTMCRFCPHWLFVPIRITEVGDQLHILPMVEQYVDTVSEHWIEDHLDLFAKHDLVEWLDTRLNFFAYLTADVLKHRSKWRAVLKVLRNIKLLAGR